VRAHDNSEWQCLMASQAERSKAGSRRKSHRRRRSLRPRTFISDTVVAPVPLTLSYGWNPARSNQPRNRSWFRVAVSPQWSAGRSVNDRPGVLWR